MNIIYDYSARDSNLPDMMEVNPATDMKNRGFTWRGVQVCAADLAAIKFIDVSGDVSQLPVYLQVEK